VRQRILCVNPEHKEATPSMVIYDEYAHCFGCGYRVPIDSLGKLGVSRAPRVEPSDLKGELERIKALPTARVRGLELPVDGDSYYILWPSNDYYKRRKFIPGEGSKYLCPRGHAKPLFIPYEIKGANTLAVVEGEINALSLATLKPNYSICSPGGVGDFSEKMFYKYNTFFLRHKRFALILDKDSPGLEAAIKFKKLLLKHTHDVQVHLVSPDLNDLLMQGKLQDEAKKWGGVGL
jgi:hypothetical protein